MEEMDVDQVEKTTAIIRLGGEVIIAVYSLDDTLPNAVFTCQTFSSEYAGSLFWTTSPAKKKITVVKVLLSLKEGIYNVPLDKSLLEISSCNSTGWPLDLSIPPIPNQHTQ